MLMMDMMLTVLLGYFLPLIPERMVVKDDVCLVCVAGAGMFPKRSSDVWSHRSCGHLDNFGIH